MENNAIRRVMFGGFDKQDVIQYIEKTVQDSEDAQQELQEENETLRRENDALTQRIELLNAQNTQLTADQEKLIAERDRLKAALEQAKTAQQKLQGMGTALEQLNSEVETLRPDAQAYARFRDQIGAIECESRSRAADLEDATADQMLSVIQRFQESYQNVMRTFETASSHVVGELRKVEVNLSQLPRAMDKTGTELNALEEMLRSAKKKKED